MLVFNFSHNQSQGWKGWGEGWGLWFRSGRARLKLGRGGARPGSSHFFLALTLPLAFFSSLPFPLSLPFPFPRFFFLDLSMERTR